MHSEEKPCRACLDFRSWFRKSTELRKGSSSKQDGPKGTAETLTTTEERESKPCPPDKNDLGQSTWSLLHSMAAYLPERSDGNVQRDMAELMRLMSLYYPCEFCAKDLKIYLKKYPPDTGSRQAFSQWLCRLHNSVNRKLGKPEFDCSLVDQRWRDGWTDGSCDG